MKIAHLTTVDMSLRYLVWPQLLAGRQHGEAIGISAPGEFVGELEAEGIRHIPLPSSTRGMNLLADLRATIELWRILRRERIDVLHTHNPKPGVYGRIVGRLAGVPIVVNTVHGLYATPDSPLSKRIVVYGLEWLASRFSDVELIQNPEDVELLRRLHIVPRPKLRLLGNGVDLDRFDPVRAAAARDQVRAELGVGESQVVVGAVGRLVAEKGVAELIEAAERLDGRFVVVWVGPHDPDKDDAISEVVIDRAREAGVRLLGMRRDVERLYGGFDIFVLPSHREGFPRAAMEAAASGLPVVATDIRGCRQVVDHGVNGLLIPVGDAQALAEAVATLGDDDDSRMTMGRASARKAREQFDEAAVVEKVFSAYRDVAGEKGLGWMFERAEAGTTIRAARPGEGRVVAELHRRSIESGFLSTLGTRFLSLLYEAIIGHREGVVLVADHRGQVVGFISGVLSTGAFYRRFLRRYWLKTVLALLPGGMRPSLLRRALETLSYGRESRGEATGELLSMGVAPAFRGIGVGARLIGGLQGWADERRPASLRVVVGSDNERAIAVYRRAGFKDVRTLQVHRGEPSLEMLWPR